MMASRCIRQLLPITGLVAIAVFGGIASASTTTTITFGHWVSGSDTQVWNQIVGIFEQQHPDIHVVTLYGGGSNGFDRDKTSVMFAAGTPPDVFRIDDDEVPYYSSRGLLLNLDPLIARDKARFAPIPDNIVHLVANDDGTQAMAPFLRPLAMGINLRMFADRGLDLPAFDWEHTWTWEQFRADGLKIARDTNGDGQNDVFFRDNLSSTHWLPFVVQNGGEIYRDGQWVLDAPESIEAFQLLQEMIWKDHTIQAPTSRGGSFYDDTMALVDVASSSIGGIRKSGGDSLEWDIVPHPIEKQPGTELYITTFAIPKSTPHPEAAWSFLKFLYSDEVQTLIARAGQDMPANPAIAQSVWVDPSRAPKHMSVLAQSLRWGHTLPFIAEMGDIQKRADPLIEKIWRNELPAEQAIKEYSRIARQVLSDG